MKARRKRARKLRSYQEPVRRPGRGTIDLRWWPDYVARGLEQLDAYRDEGHAP